MTNRLFAGTEVEGPFKGQRTLFVQGDVPVKVILNEFGKDEYFNIYFGATYKVYTSEPSRVNMDTVLEVHTAIVNNIESPNVLVEHRESTMVGLNLVCRPRLYFIRVVEHLDEVIYYFSKQASIAPKGYFEQLFFKYVSHTGVVVINAKAFLTTIRREYNSLDDKELYVSNA